jgi:MFS family permease
MLAAELAPMSSRAVGPGYRWWLVALLWLCGFFNYADRQAVYGVFPLLGEEFHLTKAQLGLVGSAFMVVYALSAPLAGFAVDLASRRTLIVAGLGFWSLICAATATSRSYGHLLFFRAAEGLGESFYFPASMSLLAAYHGPDTRSRAMSLHQTSVYAGTALGGALAGHLGQHFGWRAPFWVLGLIGMALAPLLATFIVEPARGKPGAQSLPLDDAIGADVQGPGLLRNWALIVRVPTACALLLAFAGANFVAMALLTWLPNYVKESYGLELTGATIVASLFMPSANLVGALCGGVLADRAAGRAGGRIRVQAAGLLLGAPFVFLVGSAGSIPVLIVALIGIGLCKGVYDANIFASVYDVIPAEVRGTAAGLMNTVGWVGGSLAPLAIGLAGDRSGLGPAIAATAAIYLAAGSVALVAAWLAARRAKVR